MLKHRKKYLHLNEEGCDDPNEENDIIELKR